MRDSQSAGRLKLGPRWNRSQLNLAFLFPESICVNPRNLRIKNPVLSERRLDRAQVSTCR